MSKSKVNKEPGCVAKWLEDHRDIFPKGTKFTKNALNWAGKAILKNDSDQEIIDILQAGTNKGNVQPPAKCNIIGFSRPPSEWPVALVAKEIEKFVFSLTCTNFKTGQRPDTSAKSHKLWFKNNNIDNCEYSLVAGLNKIFPNAYNLYEGVLTKTENKNLKEKEKHERNIQNGLKSSYTEISALDENDKLIHPPFSVVSDPENQKNKKPQTTKIQLYKDTTNVLLYKKNKIHQQLIKEIFDKYPEFKNCLLDDVIPIQSDRLNIKCGEPGFIPHHQRPALSKNKKRIRNYAKSGNILGIITVNYDSGSDWLIFDMRGLLRNIKYRGLSCDKIDSKTGISYSSKDELLKMFSGDPIIHFTGQADRSQKRKQKSKNPKLINDFGNVTFLYKEGVLDERKTKEFNYNSEKLDLNGKTLISIDLGVTNPVSVKISEINNINGNFTPTEKDKFLFKDLNLIVRKNGQDQCIVKHLHSLVDDAEQRLLKDALLSFPKEQQMQFAEFNKNRSIKTKDTICKELTLNELDFDWDKMSSYTTYISSKLLQTDPNRNDLYYENEKSKQKSKKSSKAKKAVPKLKNDYYWARKYAPILDAKFRDELNSALWDFKRKAPEYKAISKRKEEVAQMIINKIITRAKLATNCENDQLVFNIENLKNLNKVFSGKGQRPVGWDKYFEPKLENRWLISALKKAITNLTGKGFTVMLSNPAYTSKACISCEHYHIDNRDGEKFKCMNCGHEAHADLDVATTNLEKIACRKKKVADWAKGI